MVVRGHGFRAADDVMVVELFTTPLSGRAFFAAAFGVLAGVITLVGGVIAGPAAASMPVLAWLVLGAQFAAGVLLVVGGLRVQRRPLVAGAVLDLAVCGAYLAYLAPTDPGLVWFPLGFAAVVATCLVLDHAAARHDAR
jgi:hypothetical protein